MYKIKIHKQLDNTLDGIEGGEYKEPTDESQVNQHIPYITR